MNEAAADNKIKRLLLFVANIINSWIPAINRGRYVYFLNEYINMKEEEKNE